MHIQHEVFPIYAHINNIINPVIEKQDLKESFNEREWLDKRIQLVDEKLKSLPKKVQDAKIEKTVNELTPVWKDFTEKLIQAISHNGPASDALQTSGKKIAGLIAELRKPQNVKIDLGKQKIKKSPLTGIPSKKLLEKANKYFAKQQKKEYKEHKKFLEKLKPFLKDITKRFDKKVKKAQKAHPKAKITYQTLSEKILERLEKIDQRRLKKLCDVKVKDLKKLKPLQMRDALLSKFKPLNIKSKEMQKELKKEIDLQTYVVSLFAKINKGHYGKKILTEFEELSEKIFANEAFLKLLLINIVKYHNTPQALHLLVSDESKETKKLFKQLAKLKNEEIEDLLFSSKVTDQTKKLNALIADMVKNLEKRLSKNGNSRSEFIQATIQFIFSLKAEVTKSGKILETIKGITQKELLKFTEIAEEFEDSDDESDIDESSDDESDLREPAQALSANGQRAPQGAPQAQAPEVEIDFAIVFEEDEDKNQFFTELFKDVRKFEAHLAHK